jgi:hypothetical protein
MGCDIHPVVQVRKDGEWVSIDDKGPREEDRDPKYRWPVLVGRYYALFAILANVRQGYWEPDWIPISTPRGLPVDFRMSDEAHPGITDHEGEEMWMGDHSWSWVTVKELNDYDWSQRASRGGIEESAEEAVGEFYTRVMPWLNSLGDPKDVRLVFGFDS